jgi:hypothetical protein
MPDYTYSASDLKTLIGRQVYSDYIHQQKEQELLEADEPISCYFCNRPIEPDQPMNLHHPVYRSNGGTQVEPAHETCHVLYHSRAGDFREWGRQSSHTRRWAFNLKNVRNHPAYEFDRAYYQMFWAN